MLGTACHLANQIFFFIFLDWAQIVANVVPKTAVVLPLKNRGCNNKHRGPESDKATGQWAGNSALRSLHPCSGFQTGCKQNR
jgi:hypothetical protein